MCNVQGLFYTVQKTEQYKVNNEKKILQTAFESSDDLFAVCFLCLLSAYTEVNGRCERKERKARNNKEKRIQGHKIKSSSPAHITFSVHSVLYFFLCIHRYSIRRDRIMKREKERRA